VVVSVHSATVQALQSSAQVLAIHEALSPVPFHLQPDETVLAPQVASEIQSPQIVLHYLATQVAVFPVPYHLHPVVALDMLHQYSPDSLQSPQFVSQSLTSHLSEFHLHGLTELTATAVQVVDVAQSVQVASQDFYTQENVQAVGS